MDETTSTEVFEDDGGIIDSIDESTDALIDDEWGDSPADEEVEETSESDQTEEEVSETETKTSEEETTEQTETVKDETNDDWWKTMKVLGEVKEVSSIDEAKALMQKGADYDRIRTERDTLKAERNNIGEYEAFIKELAESSGVTPEQLIETTRIRFAMAKDKSLTQEQAATQIRSKMAETKAKAEAEAKKHTDFNEFGLAHPTVKGEDIPTEVWNDYSAGKGTLLELYDKHMSAKEAKETAESIKAENEKLKAELEALKTNQKNKQRSTGSTKSRGNSAPLDDIDKYWDMD